MGLRDFSQMSRNISCLRSSLAGRLSHSPHSKECMTAPKAAWLRRVTSSQPRVILQFSSALRLPHSTTRTRRRGTHSSLTDSQSRGLFRLLFSKHFARKKIMILLLGENYEN